MMNVKRRTLGSRYSYDSVDDHPSPGNANRPSTIDSGRGTLESRTPSSALSTAVSPTNRLDQPDDDHDDDRDELEDAQEREFG